MGKKSKKDQEKTLKQIIVIELYGILLFAISIIALIQTGAVGKAFKGVFRFFAGTWDFLIPLFMVGLAIYMMWKRAFPTKWSFRWTGVLVICLAFLLLSHLTMIEDATLGGKFEDQSVIGVTWNLYMQDFRSDSPPSALGGGMIGAVLYSALHFLFGQLGTKVIVLFLVLIGILLITGKSYRDWITGIHSKFLALITWFKTKQQEAREAREQEEASRQEQEVQEESSKEDSVEDDLDADHKRTASIVEQSPSETVAKHVEVWEEDNAIPSTTSPQSSVSTIAEEAATTPSLEVSHTADAETPIIHDFTDVAYDEEQSAHLSTEVWTEASQLEEDFPPSPGISSDLVSIEEEEDYRLPPYALLKKQTRKQQTEKSGLATNAAKLEQTLKSFGVNAKVSNVHRGPAVTRYEVHPDVGVKVSRIVSLTDDIALSLAAKGIRIEAPIPGKSAIGIEVPNDTVSMVTLREILESSAYHESESKLSIALGRDISGEPIVAQLNRMPHLLVAGATGSGKSVCINGIIASILYKAKPHEVKLLMIDPKMVELNIYNGIPHLLAPVVTEPKKASIALKKVVSEMERRYDLFASSGNRDIEKYNEYIRKTNMQEEAKRPLLPYIVVIVDELADLMMVAAGDVEDAICRLAQMARAAGIHLIIATQRPSVDVITGVIKANIPSRIAFGVSSQADSRTILDMAGAEKLLGRGDMLFLPVGASKPTRIQGTFLSDEEVEQIVLHCIEQQKAKYNEDMMPNAIAEAEESATIQDELYQEAVELVVKQGSASVSLLQRRFRIGYTRAARLIDAMEENGVVGPYEGSKPREVLIHEEESHIS